MSRFTEKGYFVKENAPIYLTEDMARTARPWAGTAISSPGTARATAPTA